MINFTGSVIEWKIIYTYFAFRYSNVPFTKNPEKYVKYTPDQVASMIDRFFDLAAWKMEIPFILSIKGISILIDLLWFLYNLYLLQNK